MKTKIKYFKSNLTKNTQGKEDLQILLKVKITRLY